MGLAIYCPDLSFDGHGGFPEVLGGRVSGESLLDQGAGQLFVELAGLGQASFELVAEGHELIYFGDDAVLFGKWGKGYWIFRQLFAGEMLDRGSGEELIQKS